MSEEHTSFTAQSLAERVEDLEVSGELLIAWSCTVFDGEFRVGIFSVTDSMAPELIEEGVLEVGELDVLKAELADELDALGGRWDPMWATRWTHLWTEGSPRFRLWDSDGLRVSVGADRVMHVGDVAVPPAEIEAIERYVSDDWVTRGVLVLRGAENPVFLASEKDDSPTIDDGYDRTDLELESMWTLALGSELARQLGRPFLDSF